MQYAAAVSRPRCDTAEYGPTGGRTLAPMLLQYAAAVSRPRCDTAEYGPTGGRTLAPFSRSAAVEVPLELNAGLFEQMATTGCIIVCP